MRERPSLHLKGRPSRASFVLCPLTPRCIGALTLRPTTGTKVGVQRVPPRSAAGIVSSRGHTGAEV